MQCEEFDNRLHEILDARLPVGKDALLLDHAANCAECAETLTAQQSLWQLLHWSNVAPLDDAFAQGVVAQFAASSGSSLASKNEVPSSRFLSNVFLANSWAVAAAVALLVLIVPLAGLGWFGAGESRTSIISNAPVASPFGPEERGVNVGEPGVDSGLSPSQNRTTRHNRTSGHDDWRWLDDLRTIPAPLMLTDANGRPTRSGIVIRRFTGGLQPIANSISTAFHLLRETLPGLWEGPSEYEVRDRETVRLPHARTIA